MINRLRATAQHRAPMASTKAKAAPWRADFTAHVSKMAQATFVLGTAKADGSPRARTCIFRGMWGTLPENKHNPAERNPEDVYESDMPVFTTDARMEKAGQLGGGGGKAEAVWWVEETQTQWRMRGTVWMFGRSIDAEARGSVEKRMRVVAAMGEEEALGSSRSSKWSWEREVTGHFGNLNPMMRGTFKNPPPGTPRAEKPDEKTGLALGQSVDDLEDDTARRNFLVCVIVPDEVDRVVLTKSDPRRFLYRYSDNGDAGGDWETIELWP